MTPLQAIQSHWPFSGPPEGRAESQIDADLDEEFAFHLEMKAQELMDVGQDPETARANAVASFGNLELVKKRCRCIAMEDRIMMQRIHLVITVLLALALAMSIYVGVGRVARERDMAVQSRMVAEVAERAAVQERERAAAVQNFLAEILIASDSQQRVSTPTLKVLIDQASLRIDREFVNDPETQAALRQAIEDARQHLNETADTPLPGSTPNQSGFFYIDGEVVRKGLYAFPNYGVLTLSRALTAAGLDRDANVVINITTLDPNRPGSAAVKYSDLRDNPSLDREVQPGDIVRIDAFESNGKPISPNATTQPK